MSERDPAGPPRPGELRVSDAERHQVAEVLRRAAGEGRLDLEELEQRLEAAFAAKTYADLQPLVRDLPTHEPPLTLPGGARPVTLRDGELPSPGISVAMMSAVERRGAWALGDRHAAVAFMGSVELDLRQAALPAESMISAVAIMGAVSVVVDQYTRVDVDGIGLMGGFGEARPRVAPVLGPGAPVVRVRGLALMGGVEVVRKPREGGKGRRLTRRQLRELEE
jgi:hypothetical protein